MADNTKMKNISVDEEHFPDKNFRNYILSQEYGADGILTPEEVTSITSMDCSGCDIADLTGIEYFTALQYLYCGNNNLATLDVSHNTNLQYLDCYNNNLTTLDVSQNTALTTLDLPALRSPKKLMCILLAEGVLFKSLIIIKSGNPFGWSF